MKPKGMYLSEDIDTINVMDYFEDSPAVDIKRDEQSLGKLFCFFILETILLGRALKVNPFDQPSVELIKKETKKILT